jgi:hypothetical protein
VICVDKYLNVLTYPHLIHRFKLSSVKLKILKINIYFKNYQEVGLQAMQPLMARRSFWNNPVNLWADFNP